MPLPAQADRPVANSALIRPGGLWCMLICWLAACGPSFPPFWLIEADPLGTDGTVDEQGKLRVLAIVAEPPEVRPGEAVQLTSLVVTHPQHGQVQDVGGAPRRTPWPRGVTALWLVCVPAEGQAAFEPCGLEQGMPGTPPVLLAAGPPSVFGPTAVIAAAPAGGAAFDLLVTLVVADHTQAGGAQACYDRARENHGVSPSQNHCLVATKRIRVSQAAVPNRNPALAAVWLGSQASGGVRLDQAAATFRWKRVPGGEDEEPAMPWIVERSSDAVQVGMDASGAARTEQLFATFLVTAGTLEGGRGSFLDLDCAETPATCPALPQTQASWTPPEEPSDHTAPNHEVFFFTTLRDDRGGAAFSVGSAVGR